jgi:hypothetical protein
MLDRLFEDQDLQGISRIDRKQNGTNAQTAKSASGSLSLPRTVTLGMVRRRPRIGFRIRVG